MIPNNRREFMRKSLWTASGLAAASLGGWRLDAESAPKLAALCDRLFIMDPWFYKTNFDAAQKAELLQRLGCPRLGCSLGMDEERYKGFKETLSTLDRHGIDIVAAYAGLTAEEDFPPRLEEMIGLLQGRKTIIWLMFYSKKLKPSDPQGDAAAAALLKKASDLADKAGGLEISIYPHFNALVERVDDASRIAELANRKNIGVTFNLYHWLKAEGPQNLEEKAKAALPRLNCVTINGSRPNANELKVEEGILPLGDGDYEAEAFVKTFVKLGYRRDFGLQGYGIDGDIPAKLEQSLKTWRTWFERQS
ncbi:MAG: TIM barrel protein [Candidatus Omnitrophota bacterium]